MTDESPQIPPEFLDDGAVLERDGRSRRRRYLLSVVAVIVLATVAVLTGCVLTGCGGRDSSPTAPSGPQPTWPALAAPASFGGLSIVYPPELQPTIVDEYRVGFGGGPVLPDTDMPAGIEFESYLFPVNEELEYIRNSFDAIQTDSVETIGSIQVYHLVGRLNEDVFGWGGTVHGYFVFASGGRTVVVDYDGEDPGMADYASEMVRRTLSQ